METEDAFEVPGLRGKRKGHPLPGAGNEHPAREIPTYVEAG